MLTALGLALAGGVVGGCIWLHARAEMLRAWQVEVTQVEANTETLHALPRTVRNPARLPTVIREMDDLDAATRRQFADVDESAESDELTQAARLNASNFKLLRSEAALVAQAQFAAADRIEERLAAPETSKRNYLDQAARDLGARANRAQSIADDTSIAAIALAMLVCGGLFRRLIRTNRSAENAGALAKSLIESSPDGIFAFDRNRRYIVWNRRNAELTRVSAEEAIGRGPYEIPLHLREDAIDAGAAALRGETVELTEERLVVPGGGERTFEVIYTPLYDAQGKIAGALGHTRDVTTRKALEEQLRQSHKLDAIGQLAGGIAHDFNNLLMGIGGHAAVALSQAPDELKHDLEEIRHSVARGAGLTEQLLFFARRRERPFERVELNALALDAAEEIRRTFDAIEVELDFRDPSWVSGDTAQLGQAILALATNACEAMPKGGRLRLRTRPAGADHVQLVVEDNGRGIPDDVKPHIFEPFFTTKEVGGGAGLGLASTYGIVTQCGGSIEVESAVGHGAKFTITLPRPHVDETPTPSASNPEQPATATILFVEDDPVVRSLLRDGLEEQGHAVVTASAPTEALAYVANGGTFDLLVTDVVMPELSGGQLVERLRAHGLSFLTVYISGFPATGIELDDRSSFLQKPFQLDELHRAVGRLLDAFPADPSALRLD
ncbi:MAG TPA: ATP-binding protein [Gaiellaceae bacterium]